jgi:hypothetical protein
MSTLMSFLVLDQSCEQVLNWVSERLTRAGLSATQTFNLQVARLAHPDCLCPHHGSSSCTCQMVVLLVYKKHEDPSTLVIHGQEGRAWVSLANPAGRHSNQHLDNILRRILIPPHPTLPPSSEATYESQPGL